MGTKKKLETRINKELTPNKRGLPGTTESEGTDEGGLEKRVKLQDRKENLYNELVGVASHNWPQVIQ